MQVVQINYAYVANHAHFEPAGRQSAGLVGESSLPKELAVSYGMSSQIIIPFFLCVCVVVCLFARLV